VRSLDLEGEPRIDDRDTHTVRPISIRSGVYRHPRFWPCSPATNAGAVVAALGTARDGQKSTR
jgi:polyribonucleotide nucleotidyltransferase